MQNTNLNLGQVAGWNKLISIVTALAILLLLATLVGCQKTASPEIRIGAVLPLTGPGAAIGEASKNALLLAQEDLAVSARTKIRILVEDGMTDPRTSVTAFERLQNISKVRHFITTVSSVSLALVPIANKDTCLLFANASHPLITENSRSVLRFSNTAESEATALSMFLATEGAQWSRIGILAVNDDYGRAYTEQFKSRIAEKSPKVVIFAEFFDQTAPDYRTLCSKIRNQRPDCTLLVGFGRSLGLCILQLRETGYSGPFIASLGFILSRDAINIAGSACEGGFAINYAFAHEEWARHFRRRYFDRYGTDPAPNSVIDYNTLFLLSKTIDKIGPNPLAIADYLKHSGTDSLPMGVISIAPSGDIVAPVIIQKLGRNPLDEIWGE